MKRKIHWLLPILLIALNLSACGGGSSETTEQQQQQQQMRDEGVYESEEQEEGLDEHAPSDSTNQETDDEASDEN